MMTTDVGYTQLCGLPFQELQDKQDVRQALVEMSIEGWQAMQFFAGQQTKRDRSVAVNGAIKEYRLDNQQAWEQRHTQRILDAVAIERGFPSPKKWEELVPFDRTHAGSLIQTNDGFFVNQFFSTDVKKALDLSHEYYQLLSHGSYQRKSDSLEILLKRDWDFANELETSGPIHAYLSRSLNELISPHFAEWLLVFKPGWPEWLPEQSPILAKE